MDIAGHRLCAGRVTTPQLLIFATAEPARCEFKRRVRGVVAVEWMREVPPIPVVLHPVVPKKGELHDGRDHNPVCGEVAAAIIWVDVYDAVRACELLEDGLV